MTVSSLSPTQILKHLLELPAKQIMFEPRLMFELGLDAV